MEIILKVIQKKNELLPISLFCGLEMAASFLNSFRKAHNVIGEGGKVSVLDFID